MVKKRRTAARRSKQKRAGKESGNWLWLLGGLFMGLAIGLGVYYYRLPTRPMADAPLVIHKKKSAPLKRPAITASKSEKQQRSRFDFYTLLPKIEMEITDEELDRALQTAPRRHENIRYILQVASFRRHQDADRLKARLALLGLVANIEAITNRSKTTWHRVRLGPFKDVHRFKKARRKLQRQHIDYMVVKIKG